MNYWKRGITLLENFLNSLDECNDEFDIKEESMGSGNSASQGVGADPEETEVERMF